MLSIYQKMFNGILRRVFSTSLKQYLANGLQQFPPLRWGLSLAVQMIPKLLPLQRKAILLGKQAFDDETGKLG
jgi:hypothetical protein